MVLTPELKAQIAKNPRAQMYMDSLELSTYGAGGMFWGAHFAGEFRERRGYDITPWLPFLTRSAPLMASSTVYHHEPLETQRSTVEKVRFDYVRTLTDLYIENMMRPFAEFLHENGMTLRSEISYGLPFELTRPGPEVDGIETESLEFASQIDAYRLLAGPAHLFGKQYSSETGATTRNHMLDHRFYDQIIATQLAAGITKTVLHGWASPAGGEDVTEWPGHEGMWNMFSERFDTRQPAAEFYPLWNDAIGRYQYVLRQGHPRIDVGILHTDHFTDNASGMFFVDADGNRVPDEDAYGRDWMRNRQNHWWQDLGMQDAGWTYEFFDGSLLLRDEVTLGDDPAAPVVQPDGPGYQALLVFQSGLDADVAKLLVEWASRGHEDRAGQRHERAQVAHARHLHEARPGRLADSGSRRPRRRAGGDDRRAVEAALRHDRRRRGADRRRAARPRRDRPRRVRRAQPERALAPPRRRRPAAPLPLRLPLRDRRADDRRGVAARRRGGVPHRRVVGCGGAVRCRSRRGRPHDPDRLSRPRRNRAVHARSQSGRRIRGPGLPTPWSRRLDDWSIAVESWDAGEMELITEDRGLGYEAREVRPHTAVTRLSAGAGPLRPWKDIPEVGPEVSGVGEYTTVLEVASVAGGARYLLDLGSTSGGLGSVRVGEGPLRGFDTSHPVVDVTDDLVRAGSNTVVVRVASSLNNRLLARGYYDDLPDVFSHHLAGPELMQQTFVRDYGLVGPVRLIERR